MTLALQNLVQSRINKSDLFTDNILSLSHLFQTLPKLFKNTLYWSYMLAYSIFISKMKTAYLSILLKPCCIIVKNIIVKLLKTFSYWLSFYNLEAGLRNVNTLTLIFNIETRQM